MCALLAEAQPLPSRFDVVSIRPSVGDDPRSALEFTHGGGLRARNVTLNLLIEAAYDIRPEQLSGGPGWADSLRFTIEAKPSEGAASDAQSVRLRMQAPGPTVFTWYSAKAPKLPRATRW